MPMGTKLIYEIITRYYPVAWLGDNDADGPYLFEVASWHKFCKTLVHELKRPQEIQTMHDNKGFTVMELLTVIGIIAIMASIAVPSFISWRNNSQLSRATQELYSHFQSAKNQAARRNTFCTITFDTVADNYTVFVDDDQDLTLDAGEQVLRTVAWLEYPGVLLDTAQGGGDGLIFINPILWQV